MVTITLFSSFFFSISSLPLSLSIVSIKFYKKRWKGGSPPPSGGKEGFLLLGVARKVSLLLLGVARRVSLLLLGMARRFSSS
jgi:hypothetical protein